MSKIESFQLDHNKVADIVPYLRECKLDEGICSQIHKYDFRICVPNKQYWALKNLHTFEHMFATLMREQWVMGSIVDISPMGCGTGFYITIQTPHDRSDKVGSQSDLYLLADLIQSVIVQVKELFYESPSKLDSLFHFNSTACGNYKLHDYGCLSSCLFNLDMSTFQHNTRQLLEHPEEYYTD